MSEDSVLTPRDERAVPHYDARYGWQYLNYQGDWHFCPPPFRTHKQAVDYALMRLRAVGDSPYSVLIDARAALEWAEKLGETRGEATTTQQGGDQT